MKKSLIIASLTSLLTLSAMLTTTPANAGSLASKVNPQLDPKQLVDFAKLVERTAAKHGAHVFLLSRKGRPASDMPKGIQYTHTGIAVYSKVTTEDGKEVPSYAIYNLYQNDEKLDSSDLVTDFAVDFFAGVHELQAGIAIPSKIVQQRLLSIISSGQYKALHNKNYSVVSNPFNSRYQNCTEYTLDLINAAIYNNHDIEQLKATSKAHFKPHLIEMNGFKMVLASMFMGDVTLSDHGKRVKTTTYTTIKEYLAVNDLLLHDLTVTIDDLAVSTAGLTSI